MRLKTSLFHDMCLQIEKNIAVYELLHAHARGQTDLTEEQLANVVTGVRAEATDVLVRLRGHGYRSGSVPHGWPSSALVRVSQPVRWLNG